MPGLNGVTFAVAIETLRDIYPGQPGRKTDRPNAELLLRAMKTISVSAIEVNGPCHTLLSRLSEVQKRLLGFWGSSLDLYERGVLELPKPPPITSER